MAEVRKISSGVASLALWKIEEDEAFLKAYIDGDSFPVLARIKDQNRRLEWLATRCCLRVLGINDSIIYKPNRRPFLSKGKHHISITHSFPYVAVLSSVSFFVGVDIESTERPFKRIANKYLTLGERGWIDLDDKRAMAIVWSAKEALYKLPGMEGLNSFEDVTVLPLREIQEQGMLQLRVRLGGLVQKFSMEYAFFDSFVITWLSCNPSLMEWRKLKPEYATREA